MKRVLDYFEIGLEKLLDETTALEDAYDPDKEIASEYRIIEKSLLRYPEEILKTQGDRIHELKNQIDALGVKLQRDEFAI